MPLAGALAIAWRETTQDNSASSCDGKAEASPLRQQKITQIVKTQATDFRWVVVVFGPDGVVASEIFSGYEKATIWEDDAARNNTWIPREPIGF